MTGQARIYNAGGFSTAIKHFRREKGLTQQELADLTGLHRRYISTLESGETTEQLERLIRVLKAVDARITISQESW